MSYLKKIIRKAIRIGLSPFVMFDFFRYRKLGHNKRFALSLQDLHPQIFDKTLRTGFGRDYVYHTSWAARKLVEIKPEFHIDVSSSLYFAGIASAFVPIKFYDYRPADIELSNLDSLKGDLMRLPFPSDSVLSLSCMHTVEHIGLGRYGDPLDYDGDIKAMAELRRVVAVGGSLLFVVPMGLPKIEFNAHRIYSLEQVKSYFPEFEIKEFSFIKEHDGGLVVNPSSEVVAAEAYACGCFWLRKLSKTI